MERLDLGENSKRHGSVGELIQAVCISFAFVRGKAALNRCIETRSKGLLQIAPEAGLKLKAVLRVARSSQSALLISDSVGADPTRFVKLEESYASGRGAKFTALLAYGPSLHSPRGLK